MSNFNRHIRPLTDEEEAEIQQQISADRDDSELDKVVAGPRRAELRIAQDFTIRHQDFGRVTGAALQIAQAHATAEFRVQARHIHIRPQAFARQAIQPGLRPGIEQAEKSSGAHRHVARPFQQRALQARQ